MHFRQFSPNLVFTHFRQEVFLAKVSMPVLVLFGEGEHAHALLATRMRGSVLGFPMSGQIVVMALYIVGSLSAHHCNLLTRPRLLLRSMSSFISFISEGAEIFAAGMWTEAAISIFVTIRYLSTNGYIRLGARPNWLLKPALCSPDNMHAHAHTSPYICIITRTHIYCSFSFVSRLVV